MRVAIISPTINVRNGYGNFTHEFCAALAAKNVDFALFLPFSEAAEARKLSVRFSVRCVLPEFIFRLFQRRTLGYLRRIDLSGFHLVHSLFEFPYCVLAARAAQRAHLPLLIGLQGTYAIAPLTHIPERWALKWSYARATTLIASSEYTKRRLPAYAGREYPIEVIHNGVNCARFEAPRDLSALRKKYAGKKVLLTIGGLKERKGQDLVLRALRELLPRHPDLHYVMLGGGPWRASLEGLAQDLGVRGAVEFRGEANDEEVVSYCQICDIFILTTRMYCKNYEGFGMVYLEAGACGKPVIATDAGGIGDAVINRETGLIVPAEDTAAIARAIEMLLVDPAFAARLGEGGKRYAQAHDWPAIADRFLAVYRRVC